MTRSERDLVTALRDELAAIDPSRACDRVAVDGLGADATGREASVARLAIRLRRLGEGCGTAFDWVTAADHCRAAWMRGRFLARGSLSLAGGRTHLEFVVDPAEAPVLAARLTEAGLPVSTRLRRGRGVVTSKNGEAVGTFLRRIRRRDVARDRGPPGIAGAPRRAEPSPERGVGQPPARGERRRPAARRDRDARRRRPAAVSAVHGPARGRRPARDARGEPDRAGRTAGDPPVGGAAGPRAARAPATMDIGGSGPGHAGLA